MQNQFLPAETTSETPLYTGPSVTAPTAETTETLPNVQAVTELLARTQRTVRRRKRRAWAALAAFEVACFLPLLLHFLFSRLGNVHLVFYFSWFLVPSIFLALVAMLMTLFLPVKLNLEALMQLGSAKAVPTLLDAFTLSPKPRYRKSILRALTGLLPQMQASDASLLTPRHRRIFNMWLSNRRGSAA